MSRLGVALLVWPFASALLLTIRWAGRTLYRWTRARFRIHSPNTTPHTSPHPSPDHSATAHGQPTARCIAVPHSSPATNQTEITRAHIMPSNYPRTEPR
ncbi:hypothetical protein ACVHNB_32735 [Streptomyces sp. YJ-C3]